MNKYSLNLVNASSQYASIADGSQTGLDITGDISGESWVNLSQLVSDLGVFAQIFSKYDASGGKRAYNFYIDTNNVLKCDFSDDGSSNAGHSASFISTTTIAADIWTHVAFSFDISTETMKFFINGVEEAGSKSGTIGATLHNSTAAFILGGTSSGGTPGQFFDGKLDEVRIYNTLITANQVDANKRRVIPSNTSGLVGYWRAENNYLDETSNNNDLSPSGSPTFVTDIPFSQGGQVSGFML